MLKSPFQRLPAAYARWPTLAMLLALTLWLGTQAGGDRQLYTRKVSPRGLLSLERAMEVEKAQEILAFWDRWIGRQNVIESLDMVWILLYLLCYATMLALACVIAADRWDSIGQVLEKSYPGDRIIDIIRRVVTIGIWLSWAQVLVVLVGLTEKQLLIKMLTPGFPVTHGRVALIGALTDIQILLRLIAIVYTALGAGVYFLLFFAWPRLLDRSRHEEEACEGSSI